MSLKFDGCLGARAVNIVSEGWGEPGGGGGVGSEL